MVKELGYTLSVVYGIGLVAVQSHLLRFGILDIPAIDVYYLLVGLWVLACILPSVAVPIVVECSRWRTERCTEHRFVKVAVLSVTLGILVSITFLLIRFNSDQLLFNFNAYPY